MRIYDGRDSFYQWDSNQKIVHNFKVGDEVHFFNMRQPTALTVKAYQLNDEVVADVPNILLQSSYPLYVYWMNLDDNSQFTKEEFTFNVNHRPKPSGYVYTETEVLSYEYLDARIDELEKNGVSDEQITSAVESYLDENPIQSGATAEEAAQIEQNKQDIETLTREKLSADALPGAVNEALAQAKASGEFKGEPGDDYVLTEADKQDIAEMAAELVEVPESGGNVDLIGVVRSVNGKTPDENGNVEITIPNSGQNAYVLPVGGDELGGVKNGGNVTINEDGTMTAPVGTGGGLSDDAKNLLLVILQNASFLSDQNSNIEALAAALSAELPDAEIETWDYEWDYSNGSLTDNGFTFKDNYKEWSNELTENGQLVSYTGSRNSYAVKGQYQPTAFATTTTHAIIECVIEIKVFETDTSVDQGFVITLSDGTNVAAVYADNTGFKYNQGVIAPIVLNTEYKVRLEFDAENGAKCSIDGKEVLNTVEFVRASIVNVVGKKTELLQVATGATYIKSVKYREVV